MRNKNQHYMHCLRLVILDMDGLMFDTERMSLSSWREAASDFGLDLTEYFLFSMMGKNRNGIMNLFNREFGPNVFEQVNERKNTIMWNRIKTEGVIPKKGLLELLSFLEEHGILRAVATSSPDITANRYLNYANITSRMNAVITGDQVEMGKPAPDIFIKALQWFNCAPENALVLEDSKNGLLAANAAGIKCILVPDIVKPDSESLTKAYFVAEDLLEVKNLIKLEIE